MNILIIGRGYLGSALFSYFKDSLHTVDFFGLPNHKIDYDILERDVLFKYEAVILLAGISGIAASKNIFESLEQNVNKFARLLDKISDKQKFIYASSGVVYDGQNNLSCEDDPLSTSTTIYGLTKKTIDEIASLSKKQFYGLRLGSVYGESSVFRTDLIINKCLSNLSKNTNTILYNECVRRPFLYIQTFCEAIEKILVSEPASGIYNLCNINLTMLSLRKALTNVLPTIQLDHKNLSCCDFSMSSDKFSRKFNFSFDIDFHYSIEHTFNFLHKL